MTDYRSNGLLEAMGTKHSAKHAVSYLRVSGKGQVDGDGFTRQREAIARRAKALGAELVAEFADGGVSGTLPIAERPGFAALLERIAGNGVRLLVVEKADRFARDLIESELGLRELRKLGVRVIEAEGGNDLTAGDDDGNPTLKLVRQVLAAVAEFEKSALVAKLRAARARARRETGRCEGVRPFGQLPGEPEALEALRRLARKPQGCDAPSAAEIARKANEAGIKSRSGRPWSRGTVWAILRSGA